jgi:hypothetical protein
MIFVNPGQANTKEKLKRLANAKTMHLPGAWRYYL